MLIVFRMTCEVAGARGDVYVIVAQQKKKWKVYQKVFWRLYRSHWDISSSRATSNPHSLNMAYLDLE